MKRRDMPQPQIKGRGGLQFEISARALERWMPSLRASAGEDAPSTISVLDPIGFDPWTGAGVTAKRIDAALRSIGRKNPVTVNINSPGGDMFEGLAIYNLLRDHEGDVTVHVLGLAASAASVIAMAGDTVEIARAGFLMVHNAWVLAAGNRNDLRDVADWLEPFDATMADIYASRTGGDVKAMAKLMDAETFIGGSEAVKLGFADDLLPADQVQDTGTEAAAHAARRIESALRQAGLPRSAAERLLRDLKGGQREAPTSPSSDSGAEEAVAAAKRSSEALASFRIPSFNPQP